MSGAVPVGLSLFVDDVFATSDEGRTRLWRSDDSAFRRVRANGRVARGSSDETRWLREVVFLVPGEDRLLVLLGDRVAEADESMRPRVLPARPPASTPADQWGLAVPLVRALFANCLSDGEELLFTSEPPTGLGFRCIFGPGPDGQLTMQISQNPGKAEGAWTSAPPRPDGWRILQSRVDDTALEAGASLMCQAMQAAGLLPTDVYPSFLPT